MSEKKTPNIGHSTAKGFASDARSESQGTSRFRLARWRAKWFPEWVILSFADKQTEELWLTERSTRYGNIARVALRKLLQLHAVERLADLAVPPWNRLEALSGRRSGQHSIRINDQWRICFLWTDKGPQDVAICDYH